MGLTPQFIVPHVRPSRSVQVHTPGCKCQSILSVQISRVTNSAVVSLDLIQFYKACNPSKTIDMANPQDRQYYIDFSSVRGGNLVGELCRTVTLLSGDEPTCQLFSGHIGCGKSTELFRLKDTLEQQGYHVVYFESSQDLDMADCRREDINELLERLGRDDHKFIVIHGRAENDFCSRRLRVGGEF